MKASMSVPAYLSVYVCMRTSCLPWPNNSLLAF